MHVSKGFMYTLLNACLAIKPNIYNAEMDANGTTDFLYRYYVCFSTDGNNTALLALELWDKHAVYSEYPTSTFYCEYDSKYFGWMEC